MCAAVAPRAKCLPSWCKVDEPEFVDGEVLLVQYVIVPDYDDVYYFSEVDLLVTYVHLAVSVVSPSSGRMRGVAATPKEAVYIVRMTTGAVRKDDIRTYVHEGKISDPYDGDMPRRSRAFIKSIMLPVPEEPVQTTFSLGTGIEPPYDIIKGARLQKAESHVLLSIPSQSFHGKCAQSYYMEEFWTLYYMWIVWRAL